MSGDGELSITRRELPAAPFYNSLSCSFFSLVQKSGGRGNCRRGRERVGRQGNAPLHQAKPWAARAMLLSFEFHKAVEDKGTRQALKGYLQNSPDIHSF